MNFLKNANRVTLISIGLVLAVILLLSVNIISSLELKRGQIDLTQNKLFTLSEGTREVLASIDEPITVRYYYSHRLGEISTYHGAYATRVRELLEHFANVSNGMIRVEEIDPEPFSVREDEAVNFGLRAIPLDKSGENGYFGLVATNSTDDVQTVPLFDPQREPFLEYDLTRAFFDLAKPKKKVVGLITSLFIEADPLLEYKPWPLYKQISEFFEVRSITGKVKKIDDDVDVLLIVHPRHIEEETKYAIDQFILRGGRAVVFVDPYNETAVVSPRGQRGAGDSELPKLFDSWGVKFVTDKFVGDRDAAIRVSARVRDRDVVADYLSWLNLTSANFNQNDVITSQLDTMTVASAGWLEPKAGATTKFEPLITTSTQSQRISTDFVYGGQPDPQAILDQFKPENKSYAIAARLTGPVKTAFPDGPPKDKKKEEEKEKATAQAKDDEGKEDTTAKEDEKDKSPPQLMESKGPINLVLVADTDMLSSEFWLREQSFFGERLQVPVANNADFVVNALDNLSGSDALISLRSRGLSVRPFTRVIALRNAAENRYQETQQKLEKKLSDIEQKLKGLKIDQSAKGGVILTSAQRAEFDKFRADMFATRKQLRDVQLALRRDIENLDTTLKALNIWAMPVIIAVIAIIVALIRRRRYRATSHHG